MLMEDNVLMGVIIVILLEDSLTMLVKYISNSH